MRFSVEFYEKRDGTCPVEEFLATLDVKTRAKFVGLFEILEEKGNQLREPYSKFLEDVYLNFGVNRAAIYIGRCIFSIIREKSL